MSDDDIAMDSVDSDEDIFSTHNRSHNDARRSKPLRTLRSHSNNKSHITRNNLSVRRSTRNRMQTYDNLNTSWILGTQTLKGYPMFQQHPSSSDKEMVDESSDRPKDLRERMPLRSRENHQLTKNNKPLKNKEDISDRIGDRTETDTEDSPQVNQEANDVESKDQNDRKGDRELKYRNGNKNKTENTSISTEKEMESKKLHSPSRAREGPVTRLCGMLEKDEKKVLPIDMNDDDDSSHESEKQGENENSENDDGYEDMYTRIKRTRRASQRQMERNKKLSEESDLSESSDSPGPRKYSLRKKKPTVDRFQVSSEPVRRSIRALRSVLSQSIRRRKHRSKSSCSTDSSDIETQRYDKKKSKKVRQNALPQGGPPDKKADINPIIVDTNIRFSDVGGLESHIHCLKEMVMFPMLYPDVFDRFQITPPKGVLFYGPPGTGKTLIARALANECSQQGSRKVTFFMRKGADCLSKWVGESERQLRLLFEQAQQMKPSIIFFDEIDGLAPVRSTKQDQIHASIVSTLLALMDGLNDRGEVIVIGATNRIDAIDPALRRPGRFDRELFFPLPAIKERLEILRIHVSKWKNPPSDLLLDILAEKTTGYCGSDIRALCTEAVLQGLRRTYPQIYLTSNRLLLDPQRVEVKKQDFMEATSVLVPSTHRVAPSVSRKLQAFMVPLLGNALDELFNSVKTMFPQGVNPALAKIKIAKGLHRPRMLITGNKLSHGQGSKLAQALLYRMEHVSVQTLDISTLFSESARSPEETCVQVFHEALRNIPSIIYVRSIDQWWPIVQETVKAVFMCRITSLDPCLPILVIATSDTPYNELPFQIKSLFSEIREEVYELDIPTAEQRSAFFKPIFMVQSLKPPLIIDDKVEILEELPLAPDPIPKKLTEDERRVLYEKEEVSLRELRIFLREICAKLARNRQFFMFTKPVDTEEVPDYNTIIKQPMDLETMMTKIDKHSYLCARDFLDDIDLICKNALEYNPDSLRDRSSFGILKRDPADKLIRHRACSLRDHAYALIKAELDSDFEDKCREISKNRKLIENAKNNNHNNNSIKSMKNDHYINNDKNDRKDSMINSNCSLEMNNRKVNTSRKRKIPAWARGYVKKVTKKKKIIYDENTIESNDKLATCSNNGARGVDLDKFQEFETNSMLNNDRISCDNSESENDSTNDNVKIVKMNSSSEITTERIMIEEIVDKVVTNDVQKSADNSGNTSSIQPDILEDLTFTINCDHRKTKLGRSDKNIEMSNARDFSCIGGLEKHIKLVKEMVLFPLIYGDIYAKFNIKPPRGLLFYGPPGTGKTLVASALATECSNSEKKVSFISRKGSDCLSKYVGESEKKLQKIFQLAQQMKPCIIFFDEVDGLAPVRTSRQDYVHASVVSILLALMDGLDNNSEIVIIGATNRLDAIDPALRRPGRFDRELYFPLPCFSARKDILSIYVKNWKHKPSIKFLSYIASNTVGYCGSDLQALCAEAVMCCVRRQYPQIYTTKPKLQINDRHLKVEKRDFIEAQSNITPAYFRAVMAPIKKLSSSIYPLLQNNISNILDRLQSICTSDMFPFESNMKIITSKSKNSPRILLYGKDDCHTRHLAPALLHTFEHLPCHVLDVMTLFEETGRSVEETIIQKIKLARHTLPSLLYVPSINAWWHLVNQTARTIFLSLLNGLDQSTHMLILMTINTNLVKIPKKIAQLFDGSYGEFYEIQPPNNSEKIAFFKQLFTKYYLSTSSVSNKSSYVDFNQIMQSTRTKMEDQLQNNSQTDWNHRINTSHSQSNINNSVPDSIPRVGTKRNRIPSDDVVIRKKSKLELSLSSNHRVTRSGGLKEIEIEELINRIIKCTHNWVTGKLERLYIEFEIILKQNDEL
ncbi:ATPase family AAA domain-containing protein 2-like [Chelonus insularis]|uniref:ATPase family AAA domain-containing protein 2-like n=1 Tax=Chelonus insularis TaxID=460826 RepID=UPI00158A593E|nr:ATPase family AAA domain-containing protein 2-like [Chelonus insularis]